MKVFVLGDTHGNLTHSRYAINTAAKLGCDVVFQLGDFGYWEHVQSGVDFLDEVNEMAGEKRMPVYFLDGNHDKTSFLLSKHGEDVNEYGFNAVRRNIFYSGRGNRWTWDGVRFISLGGAYSVDKESRLWAEARRGESETLWFPEEEMSDEDMEKILTDTTPVDVIFAHDKPRGAKPDWDRKDLMECWPNQDRLQRAVETLTPSLFMHGHLHYRYDQNVDYGGPEGALRTVRVIGLAPDQYANEFPGYKRADSWYVLDTDGLPE